MDPNRVQLNNRKIYPENDLYVSFGIHYCWVHEVLDEGTRNESHDIVMLDQEEAGKLAEAILRRWPDVREAVLCRLNGE